mgnify:CR=1
MANPTFSEKYNTNFFQFLPPSAVINMIEKKECIMGAKKIKPTGRAMQTGEEQETVGRKWRGRREKANLQQRG